MGIFLPELNSLRPQQDDFINLQARIINRTVWSFEEPNANSKRAKLYWHDLVVPITNTAIGDDESAHNRIWYELEEGGYAYSGDIQPVRTILNSPPRSPPAAPWARSAFRIRMRISSLMQMQSMRIACIMKRSTG